MARKQTIHLTREGYTHLKEELESLRKKLMYEIAERIKEARELGDLSENSEYDEAKNEQGKINSRIQELEEVLNNAEVLEENGDFSEVRLGSRVLLENLQNGEQKQIMIVNSQEADIFNNKISSESPIGNAVLAKKVDEEFKVRTANGAVKYRILSIGK